MANANGINNSIGSFAFDADQAVGAGTDNYVLTYDHSTGKISLEASAGITLSDATSTVYVSKDGNDSNDGLSVDALKLTIGSAITQASSLITGGADSVKIEVLDGGTYTENFTIPEDVHLHGTAITVIGSITITGNSSCKIHAHYPASSSSTMLTTTGSSGIAHYYSNISEGRGTGGSLTGTNNYVNNSTGAILFVRTNVTYVAASGVGINSGATFGGHIHFRTYDLYLAGNSATGISLNNASSDVVGYIDHILEVGSPTGTTGIAINNASAQAKLYANEIIADTAYNITAGNLYLVCPKITGTKTGTPITELSDDSTLSTMTMKGSTSGSTLLQPTATASGTITFPAATGTVALTSDLDAITYEKSITLESPTSSEDVTMWYTNKAITITQLSAVVAGTSPGVTYTVRHDVNRSDTGTEVVTSGTSVASTTTGTITTVFNDATIPADSWVWIETTSTSGTVTQFSLTIEYTID